MPVVGWTLYALFLCWLARAIWRQAGEADRAHALLEEMRQREHDRYKPPRRSVSRPGNYRESDP